jgi:hypothetical protein
MNWRRREFIIDIGWRRACSLEKGFLRLDQKNRGVSNFPRRAKGGKREKLDTACKA